MIKGRQLIIKSGVGNEKLARFINWGVINLVILKALIILDDIILKKKFKWKRKAV